MNEPPWPDAMAPSATDAAAVASAADRRRKSAQPASNQQEHGERREDARLVQNDARRVDAADLGDERQKPVPERERVAGMETPVGELVHPVQGEVAERDELAHAREMEEAVAADLARRRARADSAEHHTGHARRAQPDGRSSAPCRASNGSAATPAASRSSSVEGQPGADDERDRESAEERAPATTTAPPTRL